MNIESEARKIIVKSINCEKELKAFEIREKLKGKIVIESNEYTELRKKLCFFISKINSIANSEGKGRDDLGVEILVKADYLLRKISKTQSKSVRKMAEGIKKSFLNFRILLNKYDQNIDSVDPQLKNNQDLVEVLTNYEKNWERGKEFLMDSKKCAQLINFSQIIQATIEKYKYFKEKVENIDSEVFILVPCLTLLNALDGSDKNICSTYLPSLEDKATPDFELFHNLLNKYKELCKNLNDPYLIYNTIEASIMEIDVFKENEYLLSIKDKVIDIVKGIRNLSMNLQRNSPQDWNDLLDVVLNDL